MLIKIARLGEKLQEVEVPEGKTLQEVLESAEITIDFDLDVRVNGEVAGKEETVKDGDTVAVVPPVKGGFRG